MKAGTKKRIAKRNAKLAKQIMKQVDRTRAVEKKAEGKKKG